MFYAKAEQEAQKFECHGLTQTKVNNLTRASH